MTDEEIAVKLTVLEQETKSAKHRLDDLEVQNQAIQNLALSVKELTINMTRMMEEQEKQGQDIDALKAEPAKRRIPRKPCLLQRWGLLGRLWRAELFI